MMDNSDQFVRLFPVKIHDKRIFYFLPCMMISDSVFHTEKVELLVHSGLYAGPNDCQSGSHTCFGGHMDVNC